MGSKLSTEQKGVYYHIIAILANANVKFSKGKLKKFIRWLFLHFPQISPEEVQNLQFWDKIGIKLISLGQSGDTSSAKFVFWSLQIRTALLKQKELEKKPNSKPCTSALPVSPSSSPKPLTPKLGILKEADPPHDLGSRLSEQIKIPEPPSPVPQSPGQALWKTPQNPASPALKPRAHVNFQESSEPQNSSQYPGATQDGGGHVASSKACPPSSQEPLQHSRGPPPPFPAVPPAPPLYSSQEASTEVTSPGVPTPCSHSIPAPFSHGVPAPCQTRVPAPCLSRDPAPFSHGNPAPCLSPDPAPCSHCVAAPSPGSHGGGTPTACPQTCSCYPNASNSKDTEQQPAHPIQGPILSFAPVTYQPAAQGAAAQTANWNSFGRQLIKEICKSHKEYGPHSPYFRGLLNSELSRNVVVPHDLKQLFSCLMTSTEFKLWEISWKQLLKEALPSLQADPNTARDANGVPITIEHLSGEGQWSSASIQATAIPEVVLERVKEAAEKAFFSLQPEGPFEPYSNIKQLASEPFLKFVERLTRAIEIQVKKENAREEVLEEMAFTNANEQCRAAILSLPLEPPPTLKDMLLVCNRKVPLMGVTEDTRSKLQRTPQRVAVASPVPAPSAQQHPEQQRRPAAVVPTKPCPLCSNLGHWSSQCPLKKQFDEFRNNMGGKLQTLPESQQQQKN
ncbi:uncharacterized protein GJ701_008549 [Geothlypis trichas]